MELVDNGFLCFDGTYDYYLEKRDMLLKLHREKMLSVRNSLNNSGSTAVSGAPYSFGASGTSSISDTKGSKEDWENAKKKQTEIRKLENELKKCEEKISELEKRNAKIDEEMQLPDVATQPSKLMELSQEHEENSKLLEQLLEKWEEVSELLGS